MRLGTIAAAALLSLSLAGTAAAEGKQDFSLTNRTGYTIDQVYVAPSKSDEWEEDVLGRDVLGDGERVDISFHRKQKSCQWDLKVVYDDGEEAEWYGFDLCSVSKIKIFYKEKSGETWAEYE